MLNYMILHMLIVENIHLCLNSNSDFLGENYDQVMNEIVKEEKIKTIRNKVRSN